jgi:hypothetical protein
MVRVILREYVLRALPPLEERCPYCVLRPHVDSFTSFSESSAMSHTRLFKEERRSPKRNSWPNTDIPSSMKDRNNVRLKRKRFTVGLTFVSEGNPVTQKIILDHNGDP